MTPKNYCYTIEGTDHSGNTWSTTGSVTGEFMDCLSNAFRDSFMQLTRGKAIYGNPGVGCRGPYKVTRYLLTLNESNS
jgi:hypothetical protein